MVIVLLIAIVLVFVAVAKSGSKLRTLGAIVGVRPLGMANRAGLPHTFIVA